MTQDSVEDDSALGCFLDFLAAHPDQLRGIGPNLAERIHALTSTLKIDLGAPLRTMANEPRQGPPCRNGATLRNRQVLAMSFVVSKALIKGIAAELAAKPLKHGEFRSIAKMGGYFISLEPVVGDRKSMFTLDIDGQVCHVHYKPA